MIFLINVVAGLQGKSIFIQKEAAVLVFSWQYLEFLKTTFLTLTKLWKNALLRGYVDQVSITNLVKQRFVLNFAMISVFQAVTITCYIKSY